MGSWQRQAAGWLARKRKEFASEMVVYRRASASVQLLATPIPVMYEVQRGDVTLQANRMDWAIVAADLAIDGELVEPQAGDMIERIVGDKRESYELQPVDTESHCERLDAFVTSWLLHSRLVNVEAV